MSLLVAPDPDWPVMAQAYSDAWRGLDGLMHVHHVGSTSVLGLPAKPVIDLMPVFADPQSMDAAQSAIEGLGYEWLGPFGLAGRRYCRMDDENGVRRVQAHAYPAGHPDIIWRFVMLCAKMRCCVPLIVVKKPAVPPCMAVTCTPTAIANHLGSKRLRPKPWNNIRTPPYERGANPCGPPTS